MKTALFAAVLAGLCARAAVIEGVITENRSGRPLARATATLEVVRGGVSNPFTSVLTDSSGRFSFANLPAGTYGISAARTGFARGRHASTIVLQEDSRFALELRLRRNGAITGEVVDENQVGLAGIPVYAYRADSSPLQAAGHGASDDRGVFRVPGLAPGRYLVRTGAHELEDKRGLLPTFLGQTLRAAEARVVQVDFDTDSAAGTVQPMFGRLARLAGRIAGGTADAVELHSDSFNRSIAPALDGSFSFDRLAPGEYELTAYGRGPVAAWRRVAVREGSNEVALELLPMPALVVKVQPPAKVTVMLERRGFSRWLPAAPVSSDEPGEVMPGEYGAVARAPAGFYVESITPREFVVAPGQKAEVTVTLGGKPAKVRGKVTLAGGGEASGAPVYLYAPDPDLRARLGGTRVLRAGEDGLYAFADLPPGTYLVFTALGIDDPAQADPARYPAKSVTVGEGNEATADLELGPA